MMTPFLFFRGSLTREDCIMVLEREEIQLVISESLRPLLLCGAPDTILSCRLLLELLITWPAGERRGGAVLLLIQLEENCDGISLHRAHFSTPLFVQRSHYTLAQQSAVIQIVSIQFIVPPHGLSAVDSISKCQGSSKVAATQSERHTHHLFK